MMRRLELPSLAGLTPREQFDELVRFCEDIARAVNLIEERVSKLENALIARETERE